MHIPDGYLSPATCATLYAASAPFWYVASQKVKKALSSRTVPLLALFSAFSFVVMMFNVPLPGGTTGHAVGAALMAIVLGPWAAVIGVSVALAIQALLFGDGGILTLGANCFNMAVVIPFVAYGIYTLGSGSSPATSARRPVAAFIAGYVGITMAAFFTGLELGVQPALFSANGVPLYFPYDLGVSIPAMVIPHLAVASFAEGIVTAAVLAYLQRAHPSLLERRRPLAAPVEGGEPAVPAPAGRRLPAALWVGLGVIVVLTPLGLLAPGGAWAEWGPDEVEQLVGSVPAGMKSLMSLWPAPLPDYTIPGLEGSFSGQSLAYILSAAIGVGLIALVWWGASRVLGRRGIGERSIDHPA